MTGILNWWDGVELWLTGRGFVLQVIVVMPVVLALAYGTAMVLDGLLGRSITARTLVSRRFGHREENPR
jgi:hypothetical protein